MISPNPVKANPKAAILVYGRQAPEGLPQAAWFRIEDRAAVKTAAEQHKFSVIELQSDAERALAVGVHEGVLKGSGRMIVGTVDPEVYRWIEEHGWELAVSALTSKSDAGASVGAKASGDDKAGSGGTLSAPSSGVVSSGGAATSAPSSAAKVPVGPAAAAAKTEPSASPGAAPGGAGAPPSPTVRWESLRPGDSVLAAYWNEKSEPEGWWLATVARFEKNELVLRWQDAPEYPPFKSPPKYVAILHPEFLALGK